MGRDIASHHFCGRDFVEFEGRLRRETALLREWFASGAFRDRAPVGGFELEAWLVDSAGRPAPVNEAFLDRLRSPLVVPELARFNVEINTPPVPLHGHALHAMQADLAQTWTRCNDVARTLGAEMLMIGILPTLRDSDLNLTNMSSRERYLALNEQVLRLRRGRPITLDIEGRDRMHVTHESVMLESVTTSFQIHLQLTQETAARYYNASLIVSAPMVAVAANSPYLFGYDLWDETRIPVFEQAIAISPDQAAGSNRVSFGRGYVRESLIECYIENLENDRILLPTVRDEPLDRFWHLRLHNGTAWRWNRPLIDFNIDGTPSLRVEHRVVPAGPSLIDTISNAALYYGLVQDLGTTMPAPEEQLSFDLARSNFYAAARHGLRASLTWLDGHSVPAQDLLCDQLLPRARRGLRSLNVASDDINLYLGVIQGRLETGRNGAAWQRAYIAKHGHDMAALTRAYRDGARGGAPVHEWVV